MANCSNCFNFGDCLQHEGTKYYGLDAACNNVEELCENFKNKADFVEVKHGHWVKHSPDVAAMRAFHKLGIGKGMSENSIFWTCSCCDSWGSLTQKYCNQCGAKMDGGKAE